MYGFFFDCVGYVRFHSGFKGINHNICLTPLGIGTNSLFRYLSKINCPDVSASDGTT